MSKKVLIVDDDDTIRMSISKYCEAGGATADAVGTGDEAVEKIKANAYDAVIIDFNLAGKNGEQVLQDLKSNGGKFGKAILMSGDSGLDFKSKGFDFFLEKPSPKSKFLELLGQI